MNVKRMRMLVLCGVLSVPAVALAGTVSIADSSGDDASVTVSYRDLDINTQAGAEKLYQRIVSAAQRVCPDTDSIDIARYRREVQCRQQAVDRAVDGVKSTQLAAVRAAHSRGSGHHELV